MANKEHEEIPSFLRGKADKPFDSIIEEDAARRAEGQEADSYETEQAEADPELTRDLQTLGAASEEAASEDLVAAASNTLTQQADVPYFGVTDGIGRDLATKVAEGKQRLEELAHDIEMSKAHRDRMVDRVKSDLEDSIQDLRRRAEGIIGDIDYNHFEEVAVLRGRETDQIKGVATLEATLALLRRK